jgi:lysophospholipase L1-like esterase
MKQHILKLSLFTNFVFVILIIRHFILLPGKEANRSLSFFTHRDQVLRTLPKDTTDIIFLGDSHVQGFELAEYFKSLRFKNRGIYYESSAGLLYRCPEIVSGKPAKLFIEIGVNDIQQGVTVDTTINNLQKIISLFKQDSPKTQIYLQSVLPSNIPLSEKHFILPSIKALNIRYSALCMRNQITFINLDPYFQDNGLAKKFDSGDGVHLNGKGYQLWYNILKDYLK